MFIWKNKAGVEWELVLIDEKETENGVPMLVFKVGQSLKLFHKKLTDTFRFELS